MRGPQATKENNMHQEPTKYKVTGEYEVVKQGKKEIVEVSIPVYAASDEEAERVGLVTLQTLPADQGKFIKLVGVKRNRF